MELLGLETKTRKFRRLPLEGQTECDIENCDEKPICRWLISEAGPKPFATCSEHDKEIKTGLAENYLR